MLESSITASSGRKATRGELSPAGMRRLQDVDKLLERGYPWLYFSPEFERRYQLDRHPQRRVADYWTHGLSLLCYLSFAVIDWLVARPVFPFALKLRLSVTAIVFFGFFAVRLLAPGSPRARELFISFAALLCGISVLVLSVRTGGTNGSLYMTGLTLVVLFMTALHRTRWWYVVTVASLLSIGTIYVSMTDPTMAPTMGVSLLLLLGGTMIFVLFGGYQFEYEERTSYLLRLREEVQRERETNLVNKLSELSERYQALSLVDALTGLSNRRHFHEFIDELWPRAAREGIVISMLLIDVDHFKAYNDTYGHPAGDRCLQALAGALRTALREPSDLVARFGGEEFVAVLPGSSVALATDIARRIQAAIAVLAIPHSASPVDSTVTISVGIGTVRPGYGGVSQDSLVAAADAALYEAKSGGRNRICQASESASTARTPGVIALAEYRASKR